MYVLSKIEKKSESTLILFTYDKEVEKYFNEIATKIKNEFLVEVKVIKRNRKNDYIFINRIFDYFQYKKLISSPFVLNTFLWNPHALYIANNYLVRKSRKINLYEDGSTIIQSKKPGNLEKKIKSFIYNIYFEMKFEKIETIFVNYKKSYEDFSYHNLVEEEKLIDNLNKISDLRKKEIANIFLGDLDIGILKNKEVEKSIIFTQPLSEDGFESESSKKNIYIKMLNNDLIKNDLIFIKKHPRDKTDYSFLKKYSDIFIFDAKFPSEIFLLFDIYFNIAMGVCTSAVDNTNSRLKINTDPSYFEFQNYK